jgi:O-antigen ligase
LAGVVLHVSLAFARIAAGSEFTAVQEFYSSRFSLPVHPSYLALYLCVAVAVWYSEGLHERVSPTMDLSVLLVLCAGIVFCGSKAGWLVMLLLLPLLLLMRWKNARTRRVVVTALASSVSAITVLVLVSPNARDRVLGAFRAATEEEHRPDASTSSEVRWHTWSAAWHLFRSAPLHGTGTGDIKDALLATYEERGNTTAREHELNAHDQFLQTAACLGVFGVLVLAAVLLLPWWRARSMGGTAAVVSGIWILNLLVESMLEVQAGTLLFGFCTLLLFRYDHPKATDGSPLV